MLRFNFDKIFWLIVVLFVGVPKMSIANDSLKAILIVGHQEELTTAAIENMNELAVLFRKNGVSVSKFYNEKAEWEEIKKLSGKCSFLVYSGHGSTLGENGGAGGLCINSLITSSEMVENFKMKKGGIVCFQSVCLGAGSTAGDFEDISKDLAKERVTSYSKPFFEMGASAYYANNYGDGVIDFLELFFEGKSLKLSYTESFGHWSKIEVDEAYAHDAQKQIVIAASPGGGTATYTKWVNGKKTTKQIKSPKSFNVAMVGQIDFVFEEMKAKM